MKLVFTIAEAAKLLGISLNQRLIAKDWHGRVKKIPFEPPQYIHLGLAVPSLRESSPAAKKFITYIQRAFPAR